MKKKYILGFDIDNTVRDFTTALNTVFAKDFPIHANSITNEPYKWNWFHDYPWSDIIHSTTGLSVDNITPEMIKSYADVWLSYRAPEMTSICNSFPKALETLKALKIYFEDKYELKFITSQKNITAFTTTLAWLRREKMLDVIPNVIQVEKMEDKLDNCDVVIDDCPDVIDSFTNAKQLNKICIKVNYLYNKDNKSHFSIDSINEQRLFTILQDCYVILELRK